MRVHLLTVNRSVSAESTNGVSMSALLLDPDLPQLLTRGEAAAALRITPATLDRWRKTGRIKAYQVAPHVTRYLKSDLEELFIPTGAK